MTREEAIKKLKALESRSCEGCKYNKKIDGFMVFCDKTMWHSFTKDFCCKYWEGKALDSGVIPSVTSVINKIYNDLEACLDEAIMKAKTWDTKVALNKVKKYLGGKDDLR